MSNRILITMEGGVVQNITFEGEGEPATVVIVDYDIDEVPEDELVAVEQGKYSPVLARVFEMPVERSEPRALDSLFATAG